MAGYPKDFWQWPATKQEAWVEQLITDAWNAKLEKQRAQNPEHRGPNDSDPQPDGVRGQQASEARTACGDDAA